MEHLHCEWLNVVLATSRKFPRRFLQAASMLIGLLPSYFLVGIDRIPRDAKWPIARNFRKVRQRAPRESAGATIRRIIRFSYVKNSCALCVTKKVTSPGLVRAIQTKTLEISGDNKEPKVIIMVTEEQESNAGLASESIPVPQVQNSLQRPCEQMLKQEGNVSRGKPRLRKKALHALILKQMEFYFSDANLSKDRFLGTLIKSDPYVDLNVFLRFNKIRVLTDDVHRVAKALKNSTMLSLSEDGTKVCRSTPINPREDCEACTVYVQNLPPDANHEWLSDLFSQYGPIAYVSVPRYKSNRKIKGFAFVEFDTVEGANKCLDSFQEKNCTLPCHTAPHELLSITTFADDEPTGETTSIAEPVPETSKLGVGQKRKVENNVAADETNDTEATKPKKSRIDDRCDDGLAENKIADDESSRENVGVGAEATADEEENCGEEEKTRTGGTKKKRKRKRRGKSDRIEVTDLGLQIMAKRDWKQLRNKYLQLQRNKMKQLKQHLRKARWNQWGSSYDRKEKMESEEIDEKDVREENVNTQPKFSFTPGVIVKIALDEPCTNPKEFKGQLRADPSVKYIDVQEGCVKAYVRCDNAEAAKTFAEKHSETRDLHILDGNEENTYWNKITQDREEKLCKKDRAKQRGRDKLLKKAEKELGKHIKFDEV